MIFVVGRLNSDSRLPLQGSGDMRLMIIDSAIETRAEIRSSIDATRCEICELASAEEAVEQCDRFQPDCLTIGLRLAGGASHFVPRSNLHALSRHLQAIDRDHTTRPLPQKSRPRPATRPVRVAAAQQ
jgi:hypothetical protein